MVPIWDDSKPAGSQLGWELPPFLPEKARFIFKELEWDDDEVANYCERSLKNVREERISRGSGSPKAERFLGKRAWRQIVSDLFFENWSGQIQHMLPGRSAHMRGGTLEKIIYRHSAKIGKSPELQSMIRPVLPRLVQFGFGELRKYTAGRPEEIGPYKNAFTLLKVASFLDPELVRQCHKDLQNEFGGFTKNFPILRLFLPSVFAWGSDPLEVSDADRHYVEIWPLDTDDPDWPYASAHIASYYGPKGLGAELLRSTPDEVQKRISTCQEELRRSLIIETHRSCSISRNDGWIVSGYRKLHIALPRVGGYKDLPRPLAIKMLEIIRSTSAAAQRTKDLPGSERLCRIMNVKRGNLQKEHGILEKELRTIHLS